MRFSIVFDENGTVLAASVDREEIDKPMPGPGINAQLNQIVERQLVDFDANEVTQSPARGEADDTKSA